jgi:hypothetical protein
MTVRIHIKSDTLADPVLRAKLAHSPGIALAGGPATGPTHQADLGDGYTLHLHVEDNGDGVFSLSGHAQGPDGTRHPLEFEVADTAS